MTFTECDHCGARVPISQGFMLVSWNGEEASADLCSAQCLMVYVDDNWPIGKPDFKAAHAAIAAAGAPVSQLPVVDGKAERITKSEWSASDDYGRSFDGVQPPDVIEAGGDRHGAQGDPGDRGGTPHETPVPAEAEPVVLTPKAEEIIRNLPRVRSSHGFGGADAVRQMQAQREKAGS